MVNILVWGSDACAHASFQEFDCWDMSMEGLSFTS